MFDFRFRNCNLHLPNLARFCPTPSVHCNGAPTSPTTQGSLHHCWISFFLDFLWNKNPQGWEYMGMIHDMKFILKLGLLGARTITTNLPFCWIPCTAAPSSLPLHVRKPSSQKCLDAAPKEWQASCVCVCVCVRFFDLQLHYFSRFGSFAETVMGVGFEFRLRHFVLQRDVRLPPTSFGSVTVLEA